MLSVKTHLTKDTDHCMRLVNLESKPPFLSLLLKFGRAILSVLTTKSRSANSINQFKQNCLPFYIFIVATVYAVRQSTRSVRPPCCSFPVPVRAPKCGGFCLFYEESLSKSWGFDARI